jgi:hypothetical protein
MSAESLGRRLAWAGGLFAVTTTLLAGAGSLFAVPVALWSALPYAALNLASRRVDRSGPLLGAGLAAIVGDAAVRAAVFLWPSGSTSALALAFSPAYLLLVLMPAGALLGWVGESLWRDSGRAVRAGLALAGAAALALEFTAIARPQLLPMNMAKQRALLEAVGDPRVVTPGEFTSVVLSTASAWHQVSELDGRPGDEVLLADGRGATILDGGSLAKKDFAAFSAEPGTLWNWYSRLVQLEDGYAVVQTGGGFSRTELRRLDGSLLWEYRPDGNMSPAALRPADLDGDGVIEFYAASNRKVCRLDHAMREVWCVPTQDASLPVLAPPRGKRPGWLVVSEYRRMLRVLDAGGHELGGFVPSRDLNLVGAADLEGGRALLGVGKTLTLLSADGVPVDGYPLAADGFSVITAAAVRFRAGEPPLLAVLAGAKGLPRFRLRLLDRAGAVRYEEVFDKPVGLLPLRRPDGSECLLLSSEARLVKLAVRPQP